MGAQLGGGHGERIGLACGGQARDCSGGCARLVAHVGNQLIGQLVRGRIRSVHGRALAKGR